jgi:hypothetical protein
MPSPSIPQEKIEELAKVRYERKQASVHGHRTPWREAPDEIKARWLKTAAEDLTAIGYGELVGERDRLSEEAQRTRDLLATRLEVATNLFGAAQALLDRAEKAEQELGQVRRLEARVRTERSEPDDSPDPLGRLFTDYKTLLWSAAEQEERRKAAEGQLSQVREEVEKIDRRVSYDFGLDAIRAILDSAPSLLGEPLEIEHEFELPPNPWLYVSGHLLTDEAIRELTGQIVHGSDGEVISLPYQVVKDALADVLRQLARSTNQPSGEEENSSGVGAEVYLVQCGECGFIGGPELGHCAKCGYDGIDPRSDGRFWVPVEGAA